MSPKIVIISGVKEGKHTLCRAMWGRTSNNFDVNDKIPGRGIFTYTVNILPSVIYSLKSVWMKEKNNIEQIKTADVIIYR